MGNGTLVGLTDDILVDLHRLFPTLTELDLTFNKHKCDVTHPGGPGNIHASLGGQDTLATTSTASRTVGATSHAGADTPTESNNDYGPCTFRIAHPTSFTSLSILGAPIHANGNDEALSNIKGVTRTLINRTANIFSHGALFFLSRYAVVPRATYLLEAAPVHTSKDSLGVIDELMRDATACSCNVHLDDDS